MFDDDNDDGYDDDEDGDDDEKCYFRRVQHLEGDLEVCEDKLLLATQKLDKVKKIAGMMTMMMRMMIMI